MEKLEIGQLERTVRIFLCFPKGGFYEVVVKEKLLIHFKGRYKLNLMHYTDLSHVGEIEISFLVSSNTQLTKRCYHNIEKAILKYI